MTLTTGRPSAVPYKIQSSLLMGAMAGVFVASAWLLAGLEAAVAALILFVVVGLLVPNIPVAAIMKLYRARLIERGRALELHEILDWLSRRAGLSKSPDLYWVPSRDINAIAVGGPEKGALAVSDGALRNLSVAELAAVMAHEVAHLANNDTRMMLRGEIIRRMTGVTSAIALALILYISLSLDNVQLSIWVPVFFALAPTLLVLVQLAISRSREFVADVTAAEITGDPISLANALAKIEAQNRRGLTATARKAADRLLPGFLQTHPLAEKRIATLRAMAPGQNQPRIMVPGRTMQAPLPLLGLSRGPVLRRYSPPWILQLYG